MARGRKIIKTSKYTGVSSFVVTTGKASNIKYQKELGQWQAQYVQGDYKWRKRFKTEKEAAIAYDLKMIELGLSPVNFLKPKP